jgi:hypothetical protein
MAKTQTHNELRLSLPPGARFTIWGADCLIQFERGREQEVIEHLANVVEALRVEVASEVGLAQVRAELPTQGKVTPDQLVEIYKKQQEVRDRARAIASGQLDQIAPVVQPVPAAPPAPAADPTQVQQVRVVPDTDP